MAKKTCFRCTALVVNYYSCKCFIGHKMKHCVPLEQCYKPTNQYGLWRFVDRFPKDFLATLPKGRVEEIKDFYRRLDAGEFDVNKEDKYIVEVALAETIIPTLVNKMLNRVLKEDKKKENKHGKI